MIYAKRGHLIVAPSSARDSPCNSVLVKTNIQQGMSRAQTRRGLEHASVIKAGSEGVRKVWQSFGEHLYCGSDSLTACCHMVSHHSPTECCPGPQPRPQPWMMFKF